MSNDQQDLIFEAMDAADVAEADKPMSMGGDGYKVGGSTVQFGGLPEKTSKPIKQSASVRDQEIQELKRQIDQAISAASKAVAEEAKINLISAEIESFKNALAPKNQNDRKDYSIQGHIYPQLNKRVARSTGENIMISREHHIESRKGGDPTKIKLEILPASINKGDGDSVVLKHPQTREDRVEDALVYLAAQGNVDFNPTVSKDVGVIFTLNEVAKTITYLFGVTYPASQIKESVDILSGSRLRIMVEKERGKYTHDSMRILDVRRVQRDGKDVWYCRLHPMLAGEIFGGKFMVYNLKLQGNIPTDIGQLLFRKISLEYRNANETNSYSFSGTNFLKNGPWDFASNSTKGWKHLEAGLNDLVGCGIIERFKITELMGKSAGGRPKVEDRTVEIWPSELFIQLMRFYLLAEREKQLGLTVSLKSIREQLERLIF